MIVKFVKVIRNFNTFEKSFSVILVIILISSFVSIYLKQKPISIDVGENVIFSEGLFGSVQKINPLYADFNQVDQDIAKLVFCSLSKFNTEKGEIVEDVATHTLDSTQTTYTFTLKDKVNWHDGITVSADDIIFTYKSVIQNKKFQNHILKSIFSDVEITKISDKSVQFKLKAPNSFFFSSTVIGLLPFHLLKDIKVEDLIDHSFNIKPVGCGPYRFEEIIRDENVTQVKLKKFESYYEAGGDIKSVLITVYSDIVTAIKNAEKMHAIAKIPLFISSLVDDERFKKIEYTLPQYTALFINTEKLTNKRLRLGIKKAIERQSLVNSIGYEKVIDTPLLELKQDDWINKSNINEAMGALFDSGWKLDDTKTFRINEKGEKLELTLLARKYNDNSRAEDTTIKVISNIIQQLKLVGIGIKLERFELAEFEERLLKKEYDLLLYGQNLGTNLDTYSFWHSSQSGSNGMNLSNYKNPQVDSLIERIRGTFNVDAKIEMLNKMANIFSEDVPAVFLYTPTYLYYLDEKFDGPVITSMSHPSDRWNKLHLWKIQK